MTPLEPQKGSATTEVLNREKALLQTSSWSENKNNGIIEATLHDPCDIG